jgi:autotransporter-associated beta strand protein
MALFTLVGSSLFCEIAVAEDTVYIFSYFKEPNGTDGLHLAYSLDGLSYHAVNGDVAITPPNGTLMRDPNVIYGQDSKFHLLYTTAWTGTSFGYSDSTNLVDWSPKTSINVMGTVSGTEETWAPESFWDATNSRYMVYWSSATSSGGPKKIYYSTTIDYAAFSAPTVLYDPGFTTIDATLVKDGSNYVLFCKDERNGYKYVYKTPVSTSPTGPYLSSPLQRASPSGVSAEGPTVIKIGNTWYCYSDPYNNGAYMAMSSTDDMATWTNITANVTFPSNTRHGNVFAVPRSAADYLIANAPQATSQIEFDNQTSGTTNYLTGGNWLGGTVPGTNKIAVIQNGQTATINSSTSGSPTEIWAGETSAGTLNITGGTVTISSTGWLCSGRNNNSTGSTINFSGGSINTGNASVGSVGTTASGTINISNNSTLAITSIMYDGETGTGSIVQNGTSTVTVGGSISLGRWSTGNGSYSISGGTLSQTNTGQRLIVGEQGTGTLTVSGTGLVSCTGGLRISASSTGNGTLHLDGGTIFTPFVEDSGGTATFHFNSGTLKAKSSSTTFMQGLNTVDVEQGGAIIDTNGFNITITQALLSGSASGGLTKNGSGLLTLAVSPTYTGETVINAGQLQLNTGSTTLAAISGQGELIVGSATTATQLTASSINVGTLTLGVNSRVTISPIAGGPLTGNFSTTPVPEPGTWLLLMLAAAAMYIKRLTK